MGMLYARDRREMHEISSSDHLKGRDHWDGKLWNGFMWIMIGTSGGLL
jgi:hypothetical protein